MSSGTLILDVRRAQAEAGRRALSSWQPPDDPVRRAAAVEGLARGLLNTPRDLRDVVGDVFDNMPKDGTLLDYMNRHRTELHALFDSALAELRQARALARECVAAGQPVPSLPALEKALQEAEQARSDTLDHWVEFDPHQQIGPREDYVSNDRAFLDIEARLSPEARRELQDRLEQLRR